VTANLDFSAEEGNMRSLLITTLFFAACNVALADNVTVTDIKTKIIKGPDSYGNVSFAIKCTVKNNTDDDKKFFVTLQAVDREGFELDTATLAANLKPRESKTVSTSSYMTEKDYKRAIWRVKD
jgi:hypothetical protein